MQGSVMATTREVLSFWEKARIPTRNEYHIINKIEGMHSVWQGLKKNAETELQQGNEETFVDTFQDLFDVAHLDALTNDNNS